MGTQRFSIVRYADHFRKQILDVWEQSVLATHYFLKEGDFQFIKKIVNSIDFSAFETYCLVENNRVAGFLGVGVQKVEMLFISPHYMGMGLGKKLMEFAMKELGANQVDVNEQNTRAVLFYQKLGFKTYERSAKDDQGNDYPILRMKLEK